MKRSKLILPIVTLSGLTISFVPLISLTSCNNKKECKITFAGGEHGKPKSEGDVVKAKTKWADITKPIVDADWGYIFTGWKNQDGAVMTDDMVITSDSTFTAQYRAVKSEERITKEATTRAPYLTVNFYTFDDCYKSSTFTLFQFKSNNEYTLKIDTSKAAEGIKYFWIADATTKCIPFYDVAFVKQIRLNGEVYTTYETKSWNGVNNAYLEFNFLQQAGITSGILEMDIKFTKDVSVIPAFEITE